MVHQMNRQHVLALSTQRKGTSVKTVLRRHSFLKDRDSTSLRFSRITTMALHGSPVPASLRRFIARLYPIPCSAPSLPESMLPSGRSGPAREQNAKTRRRATRSRAESSRVCNALGRLRTACEPVDGVTAVLNRRTCTSRPAAATSGSYPKSPWCWSCREPRDRGRGFRPPSSPSRSRSA